MNFSTCTSCSERHALMRNGEMSIHFAGGKRCAGSGDPAASAGDRVVDEPPAEVEPPRRPTRDNQATARQKPPMADAGRVPSSNPRAERAQAALQQTKQERQDRPTKEVISVFKLARELSITVALAVRVLNETVLPESVTLAQSRLTPDAARKLREYARTHALDTPRDLTRGRDRTESKASRQKPPRRAVAPRDAKRRLTQPEIGPEGRYRCSRCGQRVALGMYTRRVIRHEDRAGNVCAGSDLPESIGVKKEDPPEISDPAKKKQRAAAPRSRNVRHEDEFGGRNSVRAVSGGSPGLGKRH